MSGAFKVICDKDELRLDVFLAERLDLTRTKIKSMIEGGHVRVAGKIPKSSLKTRNRMEVEGEIPEEEPLSLTPQTIPLEILYEDEYFLAVNKPKGMVVHPSFGHKEGTLVNAVLGYLGKTDCGLGTGDWVGPRFPGRNYSGTDTVSPTKVIRDGQDSRLESQEDSRESVVYGSQSEAEEPSGPQSPVPSPQSFGSDSPTSHVPPTGTSPRPTSHGSMRPGIVHRLDKGTTGVIIVAKDSKTQEKLSALFKSRAMHKTYRAVVEGVIQKEQGVIEGGIGRHPVDRKKMAVLKERGRDASTAYRVVERLEGFTYVEAYPKTGRTHQIRVHLSHIGHPVAGDDTYGKKARHAADRPLLHAFRIEFVHPATGTPLLIEAAVPQDMIDFIGKNKG
jgi:23S rRNA-/tRNA-specific pseudouridylate synthase